MPHLSLFPLTLACGLAIAVPALAAPGPGPQDSTRAFLGAYIKGDRALVSSMLDPSVVIYGSDVEEYAQGITATLALFDLDHRLWHGEAHIGAIEHLSIVESPTIATVFFDTPFSVGNQPGVTVRFAMVWKRQGHTWRLAQSSNVVPTRGQSASESLHQHR